MGNLVFQATLGGQVNLVGPNTASTYNINVPSVNGNLVTTGDTGTVTNTMLAGSIANAKLTNSSVTVGSTAIALGATSTTLDGVNIGATTAGTGAFTTLSGSTSVTTPIVKSASSLTLQSNGTTTAVTIDTSQRVGIGTASPSNILDIVSASNPTIRITDTTNNCYTELNATDTVGYVGTASNHAFGFTTNNSERMRIDSSGSVIIGATSAILGTSPLQTKSTVSANQVWTCWNSGTSGTRYYAYFGVGTSFTNTGAITSDGSTTSYVTTSDYRLKENIAPMTGALAKVTQLKPVTYTWKSTGKNGEGFIAHELQAVVPDAVTGEKDAVDTYLDDEGNEQTRIKPQGIDTSFLVATLTAAIQELKAINDTQAETLTQQTEAINALTARVVTLEAK